MIWISALLTRKNLYAGPRSIKDWCIRMDPIDRGIILDLQRNCRTSLRVLADKHGVTATAIRKRIASLEEKGVIGSYQVQLSHAMSGTEVLFSLIYTDRTIDDETFADMVFEHPNVYRVLYDSFGTCIVSSEYKNAQDLMGLSSFFRRLDSVTDVENHSIPIQKGERKELSKTELRVLAHLLDDPRKRIADIACDSGLTVKRVRRVLSELVESQAIIFTINTFLTSDDASFIAFRLTWDPKETGPEEIGSRMEVRFPKEYWRKTYSVMEPIMWCDFLVEHLKRAEEIAQEFRMIPSVVVRSTILVYPPRRTRYPRQEALRHMIKAAGFL